MPIRAVVRGMRSIFHRSAADRELSDEVEHYLAEATAAYREQGLSETDAARAARLDLGSRASVRQQMRASRWETVVEAFLVDLRRPRGGCAGRRDSPSGR